jgi:sigma-B regulation protein RsbU (phosphoserine phosphatase)
MEQRKLYRTIDNFIREAPKFSKVEELLTYVMRQIINFEDIHILGARLWKLNEKKIGYKLVEQVGNVDLIDKNYQISIDNYPVMKEVGSRRTIMSEETDKYLIEKGIFHYSATGIGEKIKIKDAKTNEAYFLYQYLMSFNVDHRYEGLANTLNIISVTLSSLIRARKIEKREQESIVELEKASEIQKSILPEHEQLFGNYEIFGISVPEKTVGGDFFDYIKNANDYKLAVVIGDAASKGVSAAAQALYVSGALKMGVEYDVNMTSLIKKINNLVHDVFPFERFVTLFYCEIFKDRKGLCIYVNAGHNCPMIVRSKSDTVEMLVTTGSVLGPTTDSAYVTESFNLEKDDVFLLYTDGLVEAANDKFEFYGEDRLKNVLIKNKERSPKEICELILEDVQKFSSFGKYSDDKTLVVIKRTN